jgi:hypothetical protein
VNAVLHSSLEVYQKRPVPQDLAQIPHLPGRDVSLGDEVGPAQVRQVSSTVKNCTNLNGENCTIFNGQKCITPAV